MKMSKSGLIITWVLALAPAVLIAIVWSSLPDMIPMHWGMGGTVRYDTKVNIWWLAVLSPVLAALFMLLPKVDPRRKNYEKFRGVYEAFVIFMMLFMLGIVGLVISESFNPGWLQVDFWVMAVCGLLFAFLGNMMPKFKSNYFVGIRTAWTLSNTEIWNKTHRLGGFFWFYGGLAVFVLNFFLRGTAMFVALMVIVAVLVLVPVVMSYVWHRQLSDSQQ
ncbi:MAG: SdpI family protein [Oscillospiraceae bacterium]|nr:SdpI family protein [Oscillospiraceae bacterium]